MKHLELEEKKYNWMLEFITAAQVPKTHLELMRELNRRRNEITYFMGEIKNCEIPFTRTRRVHDSWSKYMVLISVDEFKNNAEIKEKKEVKEKNEKKKEEKKKSKKGFKEIMPWYILTTECEIIYFQKNTLQNKITVIE